MVAAEIEPLNGDAIVKSLLQLHRPLNDDETKQLVGALFPFSVFTSLPSSPATTL